jgi:uncharacterized membrane protein HdeD (DUF308 family)
MLSCVTRNWWIVALRGTLTVILGVAAFVWPGITFEALVRLFGVYAFLDSVMVLGFGLMAANDGQQRWPLAGSLDCDLGLSPLTNSMPALRHRHNESGDELSWGVVGGD